TVIDHIRLRPPLFLFLNDPPPTVIYTLSLHDALPIWPVRRLIISTSGWMTSPSEPRRSPANPGRSFGHVAGRWNFSPAPVSAERSEEHTLNSSHLGISYAVFCLKKKKANKYLIDKVLS